MEYVKRYGAPLLFIGILVAFFACSRGESPVGKWSNTTIPEIAEFKGDKTGLFQVAGMPSLPFTWKMIDKDKLEVDVPFQGRVKPLYGKIAADVLTIEGEGQQAVYRKNVQ